MVGSKHQRMFIPTVRGIDHLCLKPPRPIDKKLTRGFRQTFSHRPLIYGYMATFVRHFSRSLLHASRRTPAKRKCNSQWHCAVPQCRAFSSTSLWYTEDNEGRKASVTSTASSKRKTVPFTPADFTPERACRLRAAVQRTTSNRARSHKYHSRRAGQRRARCGNGRRCCRDSQRD